MAKSVFALKAPRARPPKSIFASIDPEDRLSVRDLAEKYGVSPWTIYRWVATKRIPHVKVSNRVIRFRRQDVEAYENAHTVNRR